MWRLPMMTNYYLDGERAREKRNDPGDYVAPVPSHKGSQEQSAQITQYWQLKGIQWANEAIASRAWHLINRKNWTDSSNRLAVLVKVSEGVIVPRKNINPYLASGWVEMAFKTN